MTFERDRQLADALIHRQNLRAAWQLAPKEKWTAEQYEQLRAASFTEFGPEWRTEIYK